MISEPGDPRIAAVDTFLQALRVSINFISLYSRQHKSFAASVKELKQKTDVLLASGTPLKVFFTADSLSVENTVFAKKVVYSELARFFHARKIHYLQISPGVSEDELGLALEKAACAPRDLFLAGGLSRLLEQSGVTHVFSDELDYSAFLRDAGEEAADVWSLLLNEAVEKKDAQKLAELARSFDMVVSHLRLRNFLDDVALVQNVHVFLESVKAQDPPLAENCTKKIFKRMLADKAEITDEDLPRLRGLLQYLTGEDMAEALLDEIAGDEHFDRSSFTLFTRLIENQKHAEVADAIARELQKRQSVRVDAQAARKLQELFTVEDSPVLKEMYRRVSSVLGPLGLAAAGESAFDREEARIDYHAILIFLLENERGEQRLIDIAARVLGEWELIAAGEPEDTLLEFCRAVVAASDALRASNELGQLHKQCSLYLEDAVFSGKPPSRLQDFLHVLRIPGRAPQEYLKRIIDEKRADPALFKLFLRFYPDQAEACGIRLGENSYDAEYSSAVIEALVASDSPHAGRVLEAMYAPANEFIKSEIVNAVGRLADPDTGFLASVVRAGGHALKKQALRVLLGYPGVVETALNVFLPPPDAWARNNALLQENLGIIGDLGLPVAAEHVRQLYRSIPVWNFPLRLKAKKALERLR